MDFKICIIGAGVVGLAIAAKLSGEYGNIIVVEKHKKFGQETSSRNSEVIHSGVYYPKDSLKAKLCIEGRELLYQYCVTNKIAHSNCGKLVVATDADETKKLVAILSQSQINGVHDGRIITKDEIIKLEPNVNAIEAIHFPSTGIIDSHGLMKQLETDSLVNGAQIAYGNEVVNIGKIRGGYSLKVAEDQESDFEFTSEVVINASGLDAFEVSSMIGLNREQYRIYFWKGEYFAIGNGKNKLINALIYPVPNENITGLGVHATKDLNGGVKLGPNAIFIKQNIRDYTVSIEHKKDFFESARKFLPFLEFNDLHPDQTGLRPKLQKPGDPVCDFIIKNEEANGLPNFINLIGIESPGLTACLAIADHVSQIIKNN
jgi:L-2-hydroxyglutarate oxidase LhgO